MELSIWSEELRKVGALDRAVRRQIPIELVISRLATGWIRGSGWTLLG